MKVLALALSICGLNLALAAQEKPDPTPGFFEFHLDTPSKGLKDAVGDQLPGLGTGIAMGYVFHTSPSGRSTLAFKVEGDSVGNDTDVANGVGVGLEHCHYFQKPHQGWYGTMGLAAYVWSLSSRASGPLVQQRFAGLEESLALGYRFRIDLSLELFAKTVYVDNNLSLASYGVSVRNHF